MSPLGVVAALPGEARELLGTRALPPSTSLAPGALVELEGLLVRVSGVGAARAAAAARELVGRGAGALVSWGIAGGLDPELRAGDLLLPERVLARDGALFEVDPNWRAELGRCLQGVSPRGGTLLQADEVLAEVEAKERAFAETGAVAVDLESAAIAAEAAAAAVPFVALRVVCDPAGLRLPRAALAHGGGGNGSAGRKSRRIPFRALRLALALARRPAELPALVRLGRAYAAARRTLRGASELAGPALGRDPG